MLSINQLSVLTPFPHKNFPSQDGAISFDAQRTKRTLMQFTDNAGPDQPAHTQADLGLRFPDWRIKDTIVYVDEQRMLRSDCTDAHAHLDLRC